MMDNQEIWDKNWEQLGRYSIESAGNRWAAYLIRKLCRKCVMPAGAGIIDVGCGVGNKSAVLADIFPDCKVCGVDFSSQGIDCAKRFFSDVKNLRFECGDAREIGHSTDEPVAMVSAFELIEHLEDWESFLTEICDLSDKYVLLSTPTGRMREYEIGLGHYRNNKKGEVEAYMESQGYKTVDVLYAGFPFWSPITRDVYNMVNTSRKHVESDNGMEVSFNPVIHKITYFVYRYLTFDRIGDQFVGLFERNR